MGKRFPCVCEAGELGWGGGRTTMVPPMRKGGMGLRDIKRVGGGVLSFMEVVNEVWEVRLG